MIEGRALELRTSREAEGKLSRDPGWPEQSSPFVGIACSLAPPSGLSHHVQLQEGKEVSLWVTVTSCSLIQWRKSWK